VCTDGSRLRFAIINPLMFRPDYAPAMTKEHIGELDIEKTGGRAPLLHRHDRENPIESTANLVGPVIINKTKRIGKQIIFEDDRYGTQEPIFKEPIDHAGAHEELSESIRIGDDIIVKVVDLDSRHVKLGIEAPKSVSVNREEIYERIQKENKAASESKDQNVKTSPTPSEKAKRVIFSRRRAFFFPD